MSRAHRAVLRLTGWPREVPGGVEIAGVTIRTRWVPPIPARRTSVTVNLSTTNDGAVHRLRAQPSRFGPAQCPNGTQLRVTGQLLRIDTSEGLVHVKVSPDSPLPSRSRSPCTARRRCSRRTPVWPACTSRAAS